MSVVCYSSVVNFFDMLNLKNLTWDKVATGITRATDTVIQISSAAKTVKGSTSKKDSSGIVAGVAILVGLFLIGKN